MAEEKQILFYVGNEIYGISIFDIQGIEKYTNIIPVPNAPSYIDGIINLRGEIIPVFSLRNKFGLQDVEPTDKTKLIISRSRGASVAFQVDAVSGIVEVSEENLSKPPTIVHSERTSYMGAIAHVNNKLVVLINLDGVLTKQEIENMDKIVKKQ